MVVQTVPAYPEPSFTYYSLSPLFCDTVSDFPKFSWPRQDCVFLMIRLGLRGGRLQKWSALYITSHGGYMLSTWLTTSDVSVPHFSTKSTYLPPLHTLIIGMQSTQGVGFNLPPWRGCNYINYLELPISLIYLYQYWLKGTYFRLWVFNPVLLLFIFLKFFH